MLTADQAPERDRWASDLLVRFQEKMVELLAEFCRAASDGADPREEIR